MFVFGGFGDCNAGERSSQDSVADDKAPLTIYGPKPLAQGHGHGPQPEEPMKNLTKKLQRFLTSEDGPTAVEYAVMLALIVIVCLTAIQAIGTNANTTFNKIANSLSSAGSSS
jgi:pilus assembly protein Flp/PilA